MWAENFEAAELITRCWSQRRLDHSGVLLAFDYRAVQAVAQMLGVQDAEAFRKFCAVEQDLIDYSTQAHQKHNAT